MSQEARVLRLLLQSERDRVRRILASQRDAPQSVGEILEQYFVDAQPAPDPDLNKPLRLTIDFPWEQAVDLSPALWLVEVLARLSADDVSDHHLELDTVTSWIDWALQQEPHRTARLHAAAQFLMPLGTRDSGPGYEIRRELLEFIHAVD